MLWRIAKFYLWILLLNSHEKLPLFEVFFAIFIFTSFAVEDFFDGKEAPKTIIYGRSIGISGVKRPVN